MASIARRLERIERRRSGAAQLCERLALFSIPYFAFTVLGHRFGLIETLDTYWLLAIGGLLLIVAILAGIRAFQQLWVEGDEGGLRATRGTLIAIVLMVPFLWFGYLAFALPQLHDISTDLDDPPNFASAYEIRSEASNPIAETMTDLEKDQQLLAYPRVSARRYPLGSGRVFRVVVSLMKDRGWSILTAETEQGRAPIDEEGSGLIARRTVDQQGIPLRPITPRFRPARVDTERLVTIDTVEVSPIGRGEVVAAGEQDERYIEAVARSLIFGFASDVVVRLIEEEDGTLVDMRSVSRYGPHDLGSNAALVVSFMEDLDSALQGLSQGN